MTLVPNETEQALNRQYDVYAAAREEYRKKIDEQAARIERLEAALRWAVPLAALALEESRMRRVKAGHTDIKGTYKSGTTWAGIHQSEVDALEEARAALAAPSAALEERT